MAVGIEGHASLNGFVSCIEREHDKVVDIGLMTKDCRSCKYWKGKQEDPGYENWTMTHDCHINHEGSSGSMETEGDVRILIVLSINMVTLYQLYWRWGLFSIQKGVREQAMWGPASM